MAKEKKSYAKPLAIEMNFDEALERFAGTDADEIAEFKKKRGDQNKSPRHDDEAPKTSRKRQPIKG